MSIHDTPDTQSTDYNAQGLNFAQLKNYSKALHCFKSAIAENPNISLYHNNISNVYIALGEMHSALQHLHEALRIDPFVPEIYNNLGRLYYKQELIDLAITHFEKALRMNSDYWEAHYNLAHSLVKKNRFHDAATHYRESIRLRPEYPTAHFNLALACIELELYSEAYLHLKQTLDLEANNLEALKYLGEVAILLGKKEEALQAYEQYLEIEPNAADIQHNLAVLHLRDEERNLALQNFKKAHQLDPNNSTAAYMIQALKGEQTVSRAPEEYIARLFDQYAIYYNDQVKNKLNYQVPGLMRNALGPFLGTNPTAGHILDLGCGTGLCGVYFRDLARVIIGVDLSPKMIEQAKQLNTYDELILSDIETYLQNTELHKSAPYNIILAGDVLVYMGDLATVFKLIPKLLAPEGFVIFTVEADDSAEYILQPTGRFAHSSAYIHTLCKDNALQIVSEEDIVPRTHDNKAISGRLYVLKLLSFI